MIKTTITETTERYDNEGRLVEKIIREEVSEDDETRYPYYSPYIIPKPAGGSWEPNCSATPHTTVNTNCNSDEN